MGVPALTDLVRLIPFAVPLPTCVVILVGLREGVSVLGVGLADGRLLIPTPGVGGFLEGVAEDIVALLLSLGQRRFATKGTVFTVRTGRSAIFGGVTAKDSRLIDDVGFEAVHVMISPS